MKKTAIAPSNIAFIKYWGKKQGQEGLRLPVNGSISMNLSNLITTTSVEFNSKLNEDIILINNKIAQGKAKQRVSDHLDRIRKIAKTETKARVESINNFPSSTGLSSSASGFAALTVAGCASAGLSLSERELSILARQGSGSACRSIPDGFVEWVDGDSNESSYAKSIYPCDWWDILDIVVAVGEEKKRISTINAMGLAQTSPFFNKRRLRMKDKIELCKKYIKQRNFTKFGELIESEALELHAIIMTSNPPLLYWHPKTLEMMLSIQKWRREGLPVYFTINTGHDIHLIVEKKNSDILKKKIVIEFPKNKQIINNISNGTVLI